MAEAVSGYVCPAFFIHDCRIRRSPRAARLRQNEQDHDKSWKFEVHHGVSRLIRCFHVSSPTQILDRGVLPENAVLPIYREMKRVSGLFSWPRGFEKIILTRMPCSEVVSPFAIAL